MGRITEKVAIATATIVTVYVGRETNIYYILDIWT